MKFQESAHAHKWLSGLKGLEIGGSAHNPFGLDTLNVDYTDETDTEFKKGEIAMCGEALKVDIIADGCSIPVPDKSFDFVISSHVIEHFFDPIAALKEWRRIARKYIYLIVPKRDALYSDVGKPLTELSEIVARHSGIIAPPDIDLHSHYSRWTPDSFVQMCEYLEMPALDVLHTDDKVGNGFTILLSTEI